MDIRDTMEIPTPNIDREDEVKINGVILRTFHEVYQPKFNKRAKSVLLKTYHFKTIENETVQSP
jgi:hypothetical protein